jgi:hypothetical protein
MYFYFYFYFYLFLDSEFWILNFKGKYFIKHEFWKVSLSSNDSSLNEFAHQILMNSF